MSDSSELPEVPRGSAANQQSGDGPSQGRKRHMRTPGMPEEEQRARQQRRRRVRGLLDEGRRREKKQDEGAGVVESDALQETVEQDASKMEPKLTETEATLEQKPWETIVIGADLGVNLSHIEAKNREIAQQRYVIEHDKKHSPEQVAHQQMLLDELIKEREEMPDNEENNMPEDQREEGNRIDERLKLLNWGLETCQCEAEEVNIRAAIQGYRSKEIPYSEKYTLIYAGRIVDFCPTYQSFCEDRKERLDRYFAIYGPGWLWHEPPLSGTGVGPQAKKGPFNSATDKRLAHREFTTLLDSGATFSVLLQKDLKQLEVDLKWYSAQGITNLATLDTVQGYRFYEMTVSVRDNNGGPIVGQGELAVWPDELRILGGLYPVCVSSKTGKTNSADRLSGLIPFEACYMSSTPTMRRLWLGEDRRDVLGSSRMPPHMRYNSEKKISVVVPDATLEHLRSETRTPDRVIFEHILNSPTRDLTLADIDLLGERGKSQLLIVETESEGKRVPKRSVILEPREGSHEVAPPRDEAPIKLWRKNIVPPGDLGRDSREQQIQKRMRLR
ncbi:hypothetical protein Hte_009411 [Hypoxylon texense]